VGLAHAVHAVDRGLSVAVVERGVCPAGASIRNFGHAYVEAQSGDALELASRARELWLRLAGEGGVWGAATGTLPVARLPEEVAVIEEFAAGRGPVARVLTASETFEKAPVSSDGVLGALWTPRDVRVDPRRAVPRIAAWLEGRGVSFHWNTAAATAEP